MSQSIHNIALLLQNHFFLSQSFLLLIYVHYRFSDSQFSFYNKHSFPLTPLSLFLSLSLSLSLSLCFLFFPLSWRLSVPTHTHFSFGFILFSFILFSRLKLFQIIPGPHYIFHFTCCILCQGQNVYHNNQKVNVKKILFNYDFFEFFLFFKMIWK